MSSKKSSGIFHPFRSSFSVNGTCCPYRISLSNGLIVLWRNERNSELVMTNIRDVISVMYHAASARKQVSVSVKKWNMVSDTGYSNVQRPANTPETRVHILVILTSVYHVWLSENYITSLKMSKKWPNCNGRRSRYTRSCQFEDHPFHDISRWLS